MSLTLSDVRELGGTDDDIEILKDVDAESANELEFQEEKGEGEISKTEIERFIKKLRIPVGFAQNAIVKEEEEEEKNGEEEKEGISNVAASSEVEREKRKAGGSDCKTPVDDCAVKKKKKRKKEETASGDGVGGGGGGGGRGGGILSEEGVRESADVPSKDSDVVTRRLRALSAQKYDKLLAADFDTDEAWFVKSASSEPAFPVSAEVLTHLQEVGADLMKTEEELYLHVREKRKGRSDIKWLKNVLGSGTHSDKMAALTLLIQESPLHSLSHIDKLVVMAAKGKKRGNVSIVDMLKELWINSLLPEERKLKSLKQRPWNCLVGLKGSCSQHETLLRWWFEDQLKTKYALFVGMLKALSHDPVADIKLKAVGHMFDLLYRKPEQEQALLSQLVNKLGDTNRKVASMVTVFLLKLLNHHVNMKGVVSREIELMLHRPNISQKAQYYGICCLNQFVLEKDDSALATKLIKLYLLFFKVFVGRKDLDSKIIAALLTGVNRAFPFSKEEIEGFEEHLRVLFRVVHVGPTATGIRSLALLHQIMESRQSVSGRYYQALYSKLLDPSLRHNVHQQAMFLSVLFKSLKSDPVISRVKALMKRILQICCCHSPNFVAGCLILLSEVLRLKPVLWSYVLHSESSDEEHFSDVVVMEPDDRGSLSHNDPPIKDGEGCDDEDGDGGDGDGVRVTTKSAGGGAGRRVQRGYLMGHRNPLYSRAELTCVWELATLQRHYHPTVQVFAKKIAKGENLSYDSDPLEDFTLKRFLQRFVYRNPKQKTVDGGGSVMQKLSKFQSSSTKKDIQVNSLEFASLDEKNVREEEKFMHKYFSQKMKDSGKKKKKKKEGEEEKGGREGRDEFQELYTVGEDSDLDMDFAGELEKQKKSKNKKMTKKKGKKGEEEEEEEEDYNVEDSEDDMDEEEYDYNAMDDQEEEELEDLERGGGGELSEAAVEKMLLENLSSDDDEGGDDGGEDTNDDEPPASKRRKLGRQMQTEKMFVSADEFAHLLEESERREDGGKQLQWENRQQWGGQGRRGGVRGRARGGAGFVQADHGRPMDTLSKRIGDGFIGPGRGGMVNRGRGDSRSRGGPSRGRGRGRGRGGGMDRGKGGGGGGGERGRGTSGVARGAGRGRGKGRGRGRGGRGTQRGRGEMRGSFQSRVGRGRETVTVGVADASRRGKKRKHFSSTN